MRVITARAVAAMRTRIRRQTPGSARQSKDPVCGMDVDPNGAKARADYDDETYYFCSVRCREKFVAEPQLYLKNAKPIPGESRRRPPAPSTLARCIPKSGRSDPAHAQSAAWRSNPNCRQPKPVPAPSLST